MVQEFYANAAISDEEAAEQDELPYKSFVRGIKVDFSPSNIRRVMRFKSTTEGAETDYNTRKAMDQRLNEVLRDLCIPGATWKLSSGQPVVPIQLKRTELHPLAKGWQEFIIHSLVPTGNKSEVTTTRAILIHSIMQGEDVRAEEIIADNIATIAQGFTNKGNLAHPSTIYKLCKDAGVPLREFRRTPRIPELSYITAKRMETIRNTSAREAYTCWAHQQANPNLSEIPIIQILDIMQTNAEKGRPMFYGCLKSDYGASSSSQVDPQDPVPLRTAPPSPGFRPPHPPPN
ncbi:hypothetical protein PIB30_104432 [Stylosanthes scabra]|uniref:Putative plant transposon protein domain-containing protein n=1 Tax=Stylosanthes scabra TaxID=79078 RepID=A0ABU6V0S8_9FABA|nr:hypothetical protein [Stylosanthes scabra]